MPFRGQPLTAAIIDLLEGAGLLVGDGIAPSGGGWQGAEGASTFVPYSIVYAVTGGYFEGTMCEPYANARPDYIVTSIGATQQQCQFQNDEVHGVLTTQKPVVAGQIVDLLSPDVEGGATRDDDVQPPVWFSPSRWRAFMSPAA